MRGAHCLTTAALLVMFAAVGACDGLIDPPPELPPPPTLLVSEPLALSVVASARSEDGLGLLAGAAQAAAAERLVYVSLPSGAYPAGTSALIRNTGGGSVVIQPMREGGFDPIAVPAGVGDTIAIEIRDGAVVLASIVRSVPRHRPPSVVRTNPPKGKRDVALNSRVTIIFSEPIAANTVTPSSITLSRNGTPIPGSIEVLAAGLAAELVPSVPLERRTTYRLVVTQDIRDPDGDALAGGLSVEFATGDSTVPPVTAVDVTPPGATLEVGDVLGDSVQLVATLRGAQGVVSGREIIWSTSAPSVAVVSSSGLVKARAPGVAAIAATSEGQTSSAQITVVPIPVARINVAPLNPAVEVGATLSLSATTFDRNNRLVSMRAREWRSANAGVATVDPRGLVIGVARGTTTITVTSEGVSGTTTIAVGIPLLIDRVEVDPAAFAVVVNGSVQLTARAYRCNPDLGGCSEVAGPVAWSTTKAAIATVDQDGRLTAHGPGMAGITATVNGIQGLAVMTVPPTASLTFTSITAGEQSTCGVAASGVAHCWGDNFFGQLGLGEVGIGAGMRPSWTPAAVGPLPVTGGVTFAAVSGGRWHTCGLTSAGVAYCWGMATAGRLGQVGVPSADSCDIDQQETTARALCVAVPVVVPGVPPFQTLSAGGVHTCALTATGHAYCWGADRYGEVGDGGGVSAHGLPPTPVAGQHIFTSLNAGGWHTCGVTLTGEAYCWGYNNRGQLGDGSAVNRDVPVAVAGGLRFASISAGASHTCGVTAVGSAYCWGDNYYGQLGDGSSAGTNIPVAVSGGPFTTLSAGEFHTCGLSPSGVAYCWGGNWEGALGDGSGSGRSTPVTVAAGLTFSALTLGRAHTCGLTPAQGAYCWGWNLLGQLGDGSATDRAIPVRVSGQP